MRITGRHLWQKKFGDAEFLACKAESQGIRAKYYEDIEEHKIGMTIIPSQRLKEELFKTLAREREISDVDIGSV